KISYDAHGKLLTMDLENDTLHRIAKKITQLSKKNIILSPAVAQKTISGYIENTPIDIALQKIGMANNLKIVKTPDDFFVIKTPEEGEDLLSFDSEKEKEKKKKKAALQKT